MKARIVRIGNSQGIRIPRLLLEQTGLREHVELEVQGQQIVIRAADRPRQGWEDAFRGMAQAGDDVLLDPDCPSLSTWDDDEWTW